MQKEGKRKVKVHYSRKENLTGYVCGAGVDSAAYLLGNTGSMVRWAQLYGLGYDVRKYQLHGS